MQRKGLMSGDSGNRFLYHTTKKKTATVLFVSTRLMVPEPAVTAGRKTEKGQQGSLFFNYTYAITTNPCMYLQ